MLFYWLVIVRVGVLKTHPDHIHFALLHLGPDFICVNLHNKDDSHIQQGAFMITEHKKKTSMALNGYLATAQCERCNKFSIFSVLVHYLERYWSGSGPQSVKSWSISCRVWS